MVLLRTPCTAARSGAEYDRCAKRVTGGRARVAKRRRAMPGLLVKRSRLVAVERDLGRDFFRVNGVRVAPEVVRCGRWPRSARGWACPSRVSGVLDVTGVDASLVDAARTTRNVVGGRSDARSASSSWHGAAGLREWRGSTATREPAERREAAPRHAPPVVFRWRQPEEGRS